MSRVFTQRLDNQAMEVTGRIQPTACLLHLEQLPELRVLSRTYSPRSDDYRACFAYKKQIYVLETPESDIWISPITPEARGLMDELETHMAKFKGMGKKEVLRAWFRYFSLPHYYDPRNHPEASSA